MHSWRNQSPTTSEPRAVDNLSTFHGESLLQVRATVNDGVLARQFRRSGDYFVACNEDGLSHFGILCNWISIPHSDHARAHETAATLSLAVSLSTSSRGCWGDATHCDAADPKWRDHRGLDRPARCCPCTAVWNHHSSMGYSRQCCRRPSKKKKWLWHLDIRRSCAHASYE